MTANRLPNHVTPTNKVFPIVSVACAITSIWDKGVHVRRILQEFGEKISDFFTLALDFECTPGKNFRFFCTFILKMANCSKGLCFAIGKTLFWWVILFKRYKKKAPDYPRPKKYNVGGGYFFSSSLSPAT